MLPLRRLGGVVDGVPRDLDRDRRGADARLAGKPRRELQSPSLVEEVVLLVGRRLEAVEALAHDHVARRARTAFLAGMLDLDAVREQRVAYRRSRRRLDGCTRGAQRLMRQDGELRHFDTSSTRRPASAPEMARSMRRDAKRSLAWLSASAAALMARWSLPPRAASSACMAASSAARSAASSRSASFASAAFTDASSASASTRCSPSARASRSSAACANPACSMRATSASVRPYEGFTTMEDSMPVPFSRAETDSRPAESTWNVTWLRAAPATIGGMPRSSKRAS